MRKNKITIITNLCLLVVVMITLISAVTLSESNFSIYTSATTINGAIYGGNQSSNKVSFMINIYWGTEYVIPMLDELDKFDAKCTFFIGGTWAQSNEDILKEIIRRGHELANHGFYHKEHANLDYTAQRNEIKSTHDLIYNMTNIAMNLFAPPGGSYNKTTISVAESLGYQTIMWTRDTIDWRDKDELLVYSRAVKDMKGGDLVLMHPTAQTLSALPNILKYVYDNNFVATTVSECIS